jgi:uncharacterized Zn-finger protein
MAANQLPPACTQQVYKVTTKVLPLSCPTRDMRLSDAHPRVYIPIEATGYGKCPYCSAEYILTDYTEELVAELKTDVEYADAPR